jgi:hypothetical protein
LFSFAIRFELRQALFALRQACVFPEVIGDVLAAFCDPVFIELVLLRRVLVAGVNVLHHVATA